MRFRCAQFSHQQVSFFQVSRSVAEPIVFGNGSEPAGFDVFSVLLREQ